MLDYIVGIILLLAPSIFRFGGTGAASRVFIIAGIAALVYSVFTNYELGLIKVLPFKAHLTLDTLNGLFLLLSPWLFGFADQIKGPHIVFGLIELGAVVLTGTARSEHPTTPPGAPAPL